MLKGILLIILIQLAFSQIKLTDVAATIKSSLSLADASMSIAAALPLTSKPCPDCFFTQICGPYHWTDWMNRDLPSGTGDWETVTDLVSSGGCLNPVWIECQTTAGIPWWKTGETIRFTTAGGCICADIDQAPDSSGQSYCKNDYQIR